MRVWGYIISMENKLANASTFAYHASKFALSDLILVVLVHLKLTRSQTNTCKLSKSFKVNRPWLRGRSKIISIVMRDVSMLIQLHTKYSWPTTVVHHKLDLITNSYIVEDNAAAVAARNSIHLQMHETVNSTTNFKFK